MASTNAWAESMVVLSTDWMTSPTFRPALSAGEPDTTSPINAPPFSASVTETPSHAVPDACDVCHGADILKDINEQIEQKNSVGLQKAAHFGIDTTINSKRKSLIKEKEK